MAEGNSRETARYPEKWVARFVLSFQATVGPDGAGPSWTRWTQLKQNVVVSGVTPGRTFPL